jgi:hypothetical protein
MMYPLQSTILRLLALVHLSLCLEPRGYWKPFPNNNNDTLVDIKNMIGCQYAAGFGLNTTYYFLDSGLVEMVFDSIDSHNTTALSMARGCKNLYNNKLWVMYSYTPLGSMEGVTALSLEDFENNNFNVPDAHPLEQQPMDGGGQYDSYDTTIYNTTTIEKRSKFISYYVMLMSQNGQCDGNEIFYTQSEIERTPMILKA